MPSVMTPIHKSILTKTTIRANRKDINRHDSKKTILVQSPTPSSFSSEDEDIIVSKKVFDKFRDENQAKDTEFDQPPTDENVNNTSSHQATLKFDHEFNKNLEGIVVTKEMAGNQSNGMNDVYNDIDGYNEDNDDVLNTKLVDGSIVEAQVSESQFTFPNNVLRSIDLDFINKATAEVDADCKLDHQHKTPVHIHDGVNDESNADQDLPDSQITLPDEVLPSLNAYVNLERSIIVHPSANEAQQTPMHFSRIRRPSRYKKSPFTINFDSVDEVQRRTFDQKHPFISHPVNDIEDTKITNKFMTWLSLDLLKYHSKRIFDVYKVDDASLTNGGKEYHLHEYISGFRMHATVSWHTVDHIFIPVHVKVKHHWVLAVISFNHRCIYVYDSLSAVGHDVVVLSEIEKLAKVIPICLIAYKFYENKDIDIDNHPNYKLNEKMDPFSVSVVENVPQQSSGSLDCGLYMVTYAECLTFGEGVPSVDFDPDLIRIRYASLLWDYATTKAEAEAQSDDEAPMGPLREIELTEGTEVHDI
ncbi:hypothetical protein FXO38_10424 [Capsicum annuum]|nr:hypothetical protein FXO38_10424 [Capsicum annuum]